MSMRAEGKGQGRGVAPCKRSAAGQLTMPLTVCACRLEVAVKKHAPSLVNILGVSACRQECKQDMWCVAARR